MSVRKDISGQVINKWRVLNYSHTKGKIAYYNCICLGCGKDFTVDGRNIRSGRSKSCHECSRKRTVRANRGKVRSKYDPKTASFRRIYSNYMKSAKRRGKVFKLTFESFLTLSTSKCFYCNTDPNLHVNPLKNTGRSKEREEEGWIYMNGIDRVNSSIGYTDNNTVPCCTICNYAKHTMSLEQFKDWIKKVYKNLKNF